MVHRVPAAARTGVHVPAYYDANLPVRALEKEPQRLLEEAMTDCVFFVDVVNAVTGSSRRCSDLSPLYWWAAPSIR